MIVPIDRHRHRHLFVQLCPSKAITTHSGLRILGVYPQESIASMHCITYHIYRRLLLPLTIIDQLCPSTAIATHDEWSILGVFHNNSLLPQSIWIIVDRTICIEGHCCANSHSSIVFINSYRHPQRTILCFGKKLFSQHGVYLTRGICNYCGRQHQMITCVHQ